jgi:glycylpeptide N-tetradecanoyltransferase
MNFWNEQPIIILSESNEENAFQPIFQLTSNAVSMDLPQGFAYKTMSLGTHLDDIYNLIRNHYVENDGMKVYYSKPALQWYLRKMPSNWLVGLTFNHKLIGFVCAGVIEITTNDVNHYVPFINLLCLQTKIRNKYFCPLMLLEIRRRIVSDGYNFGMFTDVHPILNSFASVSCYIIPVNSDRLIRLDLLKTFFKPQILADENPLSMLKLEDVDQVCELLNSFLSTYTIRQRFTADNFEEWFMSYRDVIYSWVIRDDDVVTDFISVTFLKYFDVKSSSELLIANLFYYVQNSYSLDDLIMMVIDKLKSLEVDQLVIPRIMEADKIHLNKIECDTKIHYYFYNFQLPMIESNKLGITYI